VDRGFAGRRPAKPLSAIASLGEFIPDILAALRMPEKIVMVGVVVVESCSLIAPTGYNRHVFDIK
jgi:hypothetical protein